MLSPTKHSFAIAPPTGSTQQEAALQGDRRTIFSSFTLRIHAARYLPASDLSLGKIKRVSHTSEAAMVSCCDCSTEPDSPPRPNQPGNEFKEEAKPIAGEKRITKTVNSAFIGIEFERYLRSQGISSLVIAGLTTDHCISTTTRMAGNLGFNVALVGNATATFDRVGWDGVEYSAEDIHNIHLASLNDEFCAVRSTDAVLIEVV